jgi:hypothetical protein
VVSVPLGGLGWAEEGQWRAAGGEQELRRGAGGGGPVREGGGGRAGRLRREVGALTVGSIWVEGDRRWEFHGEVELGGVNGGQLCCSAMRRGPARLLYALRERGDGERRPGHARRGSVAAGAHRR